MSYPLTLALSLTLLLSACSSVTPKSEVKTVEKNKLTTKTTDNSTTIITERPIQTNNIDIQGKYTLERGQISFGDIRKNINNSDLVIEKLNENDFGYYYTVQVEGEPIVNKYFGIFNYRDEKFVQKIITDGGEISYYDNIELIKEDERLKLTVNTNQGKRIIIWNKNEENSPTAELLKAKKSYTGVCKAKYNELLLN